MPYYPGDTCSFRNVFELIVTIPILLLKDVPAFYYQLINREFYLYLLENFSPLWTLLPNGDIQLDDYLYAFEDFVTAHYNFYG